MAGGPTTGEVKPARQTLLRGLPLGAVQAALGPMWQHRDEDGEPTVQGVIVLSAAEAASGGTLGPAQALSRTILRTRVPEEMGVTASSEAELVTSVLDTLVAGAGAGEAQPAYDVEFGPQEVGSRTLRLLHIYPAEPTAASLDNIALGLIEVAVGEIMRGGVITPA